MKKHETVAQILTEYVVAVARTPEAASIDQTQVAHDMRVMTEVSKERIAQRFASPAELREFVGLCPHGRGHWVDHCEQVGCSLDVESSW